MDGSSPRVLLSNQAGSPRGLRSAGLPSFLGEIMPEYVVKIKTPVCMEKESLTTLAEAVRLILDAVYEEDVEVTAAYN